MQVDSATNAPTAVVDLRPLTSDLCLPRLAVICDYREEHWPSMDLVADMLLSHLERDYSHVLAAMRVCPPMRRRLTRQRSESRGQRSGGGERQAARVEQSGRHFNIDRFLNRFWEYPRFVRRIKSEFDLFHVVDHSYGQLLHELPPERTIITCHDLDTFQCLLNPEQDRRSFLFRKMMERTLSGFQQAARVACVSAATRDELLSYKLVDPDRAVVVPNGVHPSCSPAADSASDREAARLLGEPETGAIEILHVGSAIPRKRIDVLLQVFAAVRKEFPAAGLIHVGGTFTKEQEHLVGQLGLAESIIVLPQLQRNVLAAVYRRAAIVLQPSEREGFGLPVVEALACGTPVVASDLPALREVGGDAVAFCPVADLSAWSTTVVQLLIERNLDPERWAERRGAGTSQAAKFSWSRYTESMVDLYSSVLKDH